MPKQDQPVSTYVIATDAAEGVAQTALSLLTGALQALVTDLRGIHETLSENAPPQSLTAHLRSTIECVLADQLEPAIRSLGMAAITTATEAYEQWEEAERWRPEEVLRE